MKKMPPLGIVPKEIWFEQIIDLHAEERKTDLKKAIKRYLDNDDTVSQNWVQEYNGLVVRTAITEGENKNK